MGAIRNAATRIAGPIVEFVRCYYRFALLLPVAMVVIGVAAADGVGQFRVIEEARTELASRTAPLGVGSLQLASSAAHARSIVEGWNKEQRELARKTIATDNRFARSYAVAGIGTALVAGVIVWPSLLVYFVVLAFLLAAGLDLIENAWLAVFLTAPEQITESASSWLRLFAVAKFVWFLFGVTGLLILVGGALRRLLSVADQGSEVNQQYFKDLMDKEAAAIFSNDKSRLDDPRPEVGPATNEPRVAFRAADVTGLALSGGGIRSATFNLGLLQGLHRRNLLFLFDYLSTVSGGGYVGAFWSDWLRREPRTGANYFPTAHGGRPADFDRADTPSERHLREFSRFLAPRWGFFEDETWKAIVALLSGLLPALAIGLSIIGLVLVAWLWMTLPHALDLPQFVAVIVIVAITTLTLIVYEVLWASVKAESSGVVGRGGPELKKNLAPATWFAVWMAVALLLVGAAHWIMPAAYARWFPPPSPFWYPPALGFDRWWHVVGLRQTAGYWAIGPRLFDYSVSWTAAALVLFGLRLLKPLHIFRGGEHVWAAFDRVVARLLGLAVLWAAVTVIWHVIINTDRIAAAATAAGASSAVFVALRQWIGVGLRKSDGEGALTRLKPYLPQILAYITVILLAVVVGRVLIRIGGTDWLAWWSVTFAMSLVVAIGLFIDTSEFGLHAFYRDRLTRAFTGANNPPHYAADLDAAMNRATDSRDNDDSALSALADRPLHLICCAANDLSGDTVETLGRGARSAVLSKHGVTMGDCTTPAPALRVGSAITASAAAFNSNMGKVSMRVGPAVSFLMTILNLRLGLWVRHPKAFAPGIRRWPGLLLYREMFGLTTASGKFDPKQPPARMRDLHLSDGGHFENLALYELVRRHCRYILLSDCGADPTVSFDDLGNALRRIREDFGIDISLDVEPLRSAAATGLAIQHVAIGTIHYSPTDRGILLYVKPALTGDEPADVLQYKSENAAFPHQSTGDQFYDEAQFESYRRLGLHVADEVFSFLPPNPIADPSSGAGEASLHEPMSPKPPTSDFVFAEAFHRWGPTPVGLAQSILAMTARFGELEMELQRSGKSSIIREVFPEADASKATAPAAPLSIDACDLPFFLRASQLMEDCWMACQLDEWWDHPLNLGWVNLYARWATAPSFRFWWPVLSPMYSPGFRDFIEQRFPLPSGQQALLTSEVYAPRRGQVDKKAAGANEGFAEVWWRTRSTQPRNRKHRTTYENVVRLPHKDSSKTLNLQVGVVEVDDLSLPKMAGWTSDDFFVPPSLWGGGFGWYFLSGLLQKLTANGVAEAYVVVKAVSHDAQHQIALDDQRSFIEQYRKIGFRQVDPRKISEALKKCGPLLNNLGFRDQDDVLFHIENLEEWKKRRNP